MQWALHLLDQISDVVQAESGPPASEFTSLDDKSLARLRPRCTGQTTAKCVIDHIAKSASSPSGHRLQLGGHIVIKCEGRSHIMMLYAEHHDGQSGHQPSHSALSHPPAFRPTIHPIGFKIADFRDELPVDIR